VSASIGWPAPPSCFTSQTFYKGTKAPVAHLVGIQGFSARISMTLGTILIIILILILLGAIPAWPYSTGWGYGPSGIVGVILIVVLILVLMGRI
jgi:hypothetical protein